MRQVEAAVHRRRVDRLTDAAANLDARRAVLPEEGGERADPRQLLVVHLRRAGESDDASGEERARLVNVERFTARLDLAPSCAVDHLQPSYQRARDAAVDGGHV